MPRGDTPFTTRDCADWMGVAPDYIRGAITEGVWSDTTHALVRLEAEQLPAREADGKGSYRIYYDAFVRFLRAIGWSRLPARRTR